MHGRTGELNAPLVSVVVLNYNYGRYLSQCLDSALAQDHMPIEIIAVDDGSTDESRAVLERYRDRVTVCFKDNGGMVSAMNTGLTLAHGPIVVFVDADDTLAADAVSTHVSAMRDRRVVRSQIYLRVLKDSGMTGEQMPARFAPDGDLRDLTLRQGPGAYVSAPNSGNAWARWFLEEVFPLPEQPRSIGAETYLMDAAPLFGRVAVQYGAPKGTYRFHETSMNGRIAAMTVDNIRRILLHLDARRTWLASVAREHGFLPEPSDWLARNWRLLTLKYLSDRIDGRQEISLSHHLKPTRGVQGPAIKGQAVAAAILLIRLLPLPLALPVASRIINLRLM